MADVDQGYVGDFVLFDWFFCLSRSFTMFFGFDATLYDFFTFG